MPPNDPATVNMITPEGRAVSVRAEDVDYALQQGFRHETEGEGYAATEHDVRMQEASGVAPTILAGITGLARGVTGGLSDAAISAVGGGGMLADLKEAHPTLSTATDIAGSLSPIGVAGKIGEAGRAIAKTAEGASAITKIGRAAAGGAVEGGLFGLGGGISELSAGDDPLTVEKAASVLSSNMLFGGAVGGVAGSLGKSAEIGLARGKAALERAAAQGVKAEGISADLATLDAKGLRAAKQAELDAIEQARVPQRAQLADDLAAHRVQMGKDKILLATKGAEDAEVRALAARSAKADKSLRGLLDNPIALAEKPQAALSALQRQQSALEGIIAKDEAIRATFAADASGARAAALDAVPAALERNKALQARLGELAAAPASSRLSQIADAADILAGGGQKESVAQKMLGGTLFGLGAGAVAQTGLPGSQYLAPIAGAGLAGLVSSRMAGKFGKAISEIEARGAKALGALLDVGKKITPAAPVLATKVLNRVRYGSPSDDEPPVPRSGALAHSFKRRADEIRSQVVTGPDGAPVTHPQARAKIASHLSAIAATNPILADKLEALGARKLEYLAAALPKRPDLAGLTHGPDTWHPSDMEMRSWARRAAAADDPIGVFERAAAGTVSPEDAETLRAVYPEMLNDFKRQIVEALPDLRKKLPFQRRLALSILTGVPVDPALDPRILRVLQSQYTLEEGTEGGTQAPKAMPAFGSVRSQDKATPAQERSAG
jgi:hypothetical protein